MARPCSRARSMSASAFTLAESISRSPAARASKSICDAVVSASVIMAVDRSWASMRWVALRCWLSLKSCALRSWASEVTRAASSCAERKMAALCVPRALARVASSKVGFAARRRASANCSCSSCTRFSKCPISRATASRWRRTSWGSIPPRRTVEKFVRVISVDDWRVVERIRRSSIPSRLGRGATKDGFSGVWSKRRARRPLRFVKN